MGNREKIIVAVLALILWLSWLARYEVSPPTERGIIVMLDRWTGTAYVSLGGGERWQEIKDAGTKSAAAGVDDWKVVSETPAPTAKPYHGPVIPATPPPVVFSWEEAQPIRGPTFSFEEAQQ